jgi:hypothetical protein
MALLPELQPAYFELNHGGRANLLYELPADGTALISVLYALPPMTCFVEEMAGD